MIISGCASTCGAHPEDLPNMRQTVQRAIMGARNGFDSCVPRQILTHLLDGALCCILAYKATGWAGAPHTALVYDRSRVAAGRKGGRDVGLSTTQIMAGDAGSCGMDLHSGSFPS